MRAGALVRLFWIGAAATLVAAALVALVAVLGGHFGQTDGKILATLGSALLAGACATAAGEAAARRVLGRVPPFLIAGCVVAFALVAVWIWRGFGTEFGSVAGSAYLLLGVELLVVTDRLMARRGDRSFALFVAATMLLLAAAGLTLAGIWGTDYGDGAGKAVAAVWILAGLAYLLTPVAARLARATRRPAAPQRVDLGAGVRVAGVTVRAAGATGTFRSAADVLYVVAQGTASVAGIEFAAGDAVLVPAGVEHELSGDARVVAVGAGLPTT